MITLMLKSNYRCLIMIFQRCCLTKKLKKYTLKSTLKKKKIYSDAKRQRSPVCSNLDIKTLILFSEFSNF